MIYDHLPEETRTLVDIWEELAWKFGMARDNHNRAQLAIARNDALEAIRSDFRVAQMERDEYSAGIRLPEKEQL